MKRYIAFLRGMNVGGHRITNDELCAHIRELGFADVTAFMASGNVALGATGMTTPRIAARLEKGLGDALGYNVPVFLRDAAELKAVAAHQPFTAAELKKSGKLQVVFLGVAPAAAAIEAVLELDCADDRLAFFKRQLFWLPRGGLSESALDLAFIEKTLGPMTVRTKRTVDRLVAKLLAD